MAATVMPGIGEHVVPARERLVGGDEDAAALVALGDQLEWHAVHDGRNSRPSSKSARRCWASCGTFRRFQSQPVDRVIELINPILRGWVNYFAVGHSSRCFNFVQDWVEKKIRRHMLRARKRRSFGWTTGSRQWLDERLGLFNGYRVRRGSSPKAVPA